MPASTPQQIFQHHAEALGAEDIDSVVVDYSDDAIFMTPAAGTARQSGYPARI
jgi:ketosteroid isomerase-like protein